MGGFFVGRFSHNCMKCSSLVVIIYCRFFENTTMWPFSFDTVYYIFIFASLFVQTLTKILQLTGPKNTRIT